MAGRDSKSRFLRLLFDLRQSGVEGRETAENESHSASANGISLHSILLPPLELLSHDAPFPRSFCGQSSCGPVKGTKSLVRRSVNEAQSIKSTRNLKV